MRWSGGGVRCVWRCGRCRGSRFWREKDASVSEVGDLFRAMAERVERNPDEEFGGALLIVPPIEPGSGTKLAPITHLSIGPVADVAAFWGVAAAKVEVAKAIFDQEQLARSSGSGFGRMR